MELKKMIFADIYPLYIAKAERKGRTKEEVDRVICWLTGYTITQIEEKVALRVNFEMLLTSAPEMNPNRKLITGSVCGVKIGNIEDSITKDIRRLDKLVDELAKGKSIEKILREIP